MALDIELIRLSDTEDPRPIVGPEIVRADIELKHALTVEEFRTQWMGDDPQALVALAKGWYYYQREWVHPRRRGIAGILHMMDHGEISPARARTAIARGHALMDAEALED